MKKLLVLTDFSDFARAACDQAVWLAKRLSAEVTFLHVVADFREQIAALPESEQWTASGADFDSLAATLREKADARLAKLANRYQKTGVKIVGKTVLGKPYVETIHAVQTQGFDLVFVGTRGESAIKRFLVGSTSSRLIQNCPAPLWVTHQDTKPQISSVLAAVDFSPASQVALRSAAKLAVASKAKLHVVHVLDTADLEALTDLVTAEVPRLSRKQVQQSAANHLQSWLKAHLPEGVKSELHVAHGDSWRMIGTAAVRVDASVIVLGSVGRGGVSGLLLGSTADRVLRTTSVSVLVVKPDGFETGIAPPVVSQW
jgi:universal stress protein E